jgi:hypothetical protein
MSLFRSHDFDERRKSTRYDLQYLAQIDPGNGAPLLSCIIGDISVGGAKLTIGAQEVPEEFTLWFRRRCRVARRSERPQHGFKMLFYIVAFADGKPATALAFARAGFSWKCSQIPSILHAAATSETRKCPTGWAHSER